MLRGTVKDISLRMDGSGDLDVRLEVNTTDYAVTIPQYLRFAL
jgi:hypothetical protein